MTTPAHPGRIPDPIFVSHSHLDNVWCREFVATLTAAGWDVWYDEKGLHGGAEWLNVIQRELTARPNFMPILTPDAWASEWVQRELGLAMLERKQIIPVLRTPTPQVSGFLKLIQWINVVGLPAPIAAAKVALEMGYPLALRVQAPPPSPPPRSIPLPQSPSLPPDSRFPKRLADLGYTALPNGSDIVIIPPLCDVPAGPFLMGSDKRRDLLAQDNELPQHTVTLPAYQIARYPVTVAEYACAVRVTAARRPRIKWGPFWEEQLRLLVHPVVGIAWKDAISYTQWLIQSTSRPWSLPTEAEWEKAARGTDGRIYPWGDQWDAMRANTSDGGPPRTTPIGSYPTGASPFGVQDMAGNVWEWCGNLYQPYTRYPTLNELLDQRSLVSRGGSWNDISRDARAASRKASAQASSDNTLGFRLAHVVMASTI